MRRRRTIELAVSDLVILPDSDPLVQSMRPSGPGVVLGPPDMTGLPKYKQNALKSADAVAVLFPEGVRIFAASRLRVVSSPNEAG